MPGSDSDTVRVSGDVRRVSGDRLTCFRAYFDPDDAVRAAEGPAADAW
jgi:hypothetical protein